MTRDRVPWRLPGEPGGVDEGGVAPGKVTLTERLVSRRAVQRRPAAAAAGAARDAEPARSGVGEAGARTEEGPFGLHLSADAPAPVRPLSAIYTTPQTADAYFAVHQRLVIEAVRARLTATPLTLPPGFAWVPGGRGGAEVVVAELAAELAPVDSYDRLRGLLYPADPWYLIDAHRTLTEGEAGSRVDGRPAAGPIDWSPAVGQVLASELAQRLDESLRRLAPRYAAQAGPHGRAVAAGELVTSHPVDRLTAPLLCDRQVVRFQPGAKRAKPPAGSDFAHGIGIVDWVWLGPTDPALWNWVRVDAPGATAEEVSAALFSDDELRTDLAYAITGSAPFFRIPPAWARRFPQAASFEPARARSHEPGAPDRPGDEAPVDEPGSALALADSALATEAALAQTADERRPARGPGGAAALDALADKLARSGRSLARGAEALAPWRLAHLVGPATRWVARLQDNLAALPDARRAALTPVIEGQDQLLFEATPALHELAELAASSGLGPDDPDAAVFVEVLHQLGAAMGESHLVDTARAQLARGQRLRQQLPLRLIDRSIGGLRDANRELADRGATAEARQARDTEGRLTTQQFALRAQEGAGTLDPAAVLSLTVSVREETLRARAQALVVEVATAARDLRGADDDDVENLANLFDGDGPRIALRLDRFGAELRAMQERWVTQRHDAVVAARVATLRKADEGPAGDQARAKVVEAQEGELAALVESHGLDELVRRAGHEVEDARRRTVWVQIGLLIGVSLVGGVAGRFVAGSVRGAMLARTAVTSAEYLTTLSEARLAGGAAGLVADATVNAAGQVAITDDTAGRALTENLAGNMTVLAALAPLRGVMSEWRAGVAVEHANQGAWRRLGMKGAMHGAELTAEMVIAAAAGHVAERIAGRPPPTELEASDLMVQGASMAIGRFLGGRLSALEARVEAYGERGALLRRRARALRKTLTGLERHRDSAVAIAALREHAALVNDEATLLEQLTAVTDAGASPHDRLAAIGRRGLDGDTLDALRTANQADRVGLRDAAVGNLTFHLAGLRPDDASGLHWAGTAEQIQGALAHAEATGFAVDVRRVEVGDGRGRTWQARFDDRVLTFTELPQPVRGREATGQHPKPDTATPSQPDKPSLAVVAPRDRTSVSMPAGEEGGAAVAMPPQHGAAHARLPAENVEATSARVATPKPGVFEDIGDANLDGWNFEDMRTREWDGTIVFVTEVEVGGKTGYLERAYNPKTKTFEMRNAFLDKLPRWIEGGTPLVDGKGTPTVAYLTMRQMKMLGVNYAALEHVKMSTIQNVKAIIQLHVLRQKGVDPDVAVMQTHSIQYAETTIVQSGHKVVAAHVSGDTWTKPLDFLLKHYEKGDPVVAARHDQLIREFGEGLVTRDTVVWMNYDIHLDVVPFSEGGS